MFTFIFVYKGSILSGGCPSVFRELPRVLQGVPGPFPILQGQGQEIGGLCEVRDFPKLIPPQPTQNMQLYFSVTGRDCRGPFKAAVNPMVLLDEDRAHRVLRNTSLALSGYYCFQ